MKKILIGVLLSVSLVGSIYAEEILIAKGKNDKIEWYGFPETFTIYEDGYTLLISAKEENKKETRYYVGITKEECNKGYGVLKMRYPDKEEWYNGSNVAINKPSLVADFLTVSLCNGGKLIEKTLTKYNMVNI